MSHFSTWTVADIEAHNSRISGQRVKPEEKPLLKASACDEESVLHDRIIRHCRENGWLYFHGSMAHKSYRTKGENDFHILMPGGRVAFIECKKKDGKLSPDQRAVIAMAERLGTKIHVVYSFEQFLEIVKQPEEFKDIIP